MKIKNYYDILEINKNLIKKEVYNLIKKEIIQKKHKVYNKKIINL